MIHKLTILFYLKVNHQSLKEEQHKILGFILLYDHQNYPNFKAISFIKKYNLIYIVHNVYLFVIWIIVNKINSTDILKNSRHIFNGLL